VSRYSGFSELGDGAQRQDVQVSANWETAHSVKMFRFQRTGAGAFSRYSGFSELGMAQFKDIQVSANWG
jgi:hypothetical protein